MSTVFDIRNIRLPKLTRATVIIGSLVIVLALVVGFVGWRLYAKLTNNTVVAYFPAANALYPGDKVQIMGLRVGAIDKIEPAGDRMKVTFHYENKYRVPANANAVILNPTLVASRAIQLEPPYKGGPVLADNAVIPEERTQVPVEWDQLRNSITNIISKLGPTPEQPTGPFGEVIESYASGLAGKGKEINTTLSNLSQALTALNEGRGDFFAVVKSLALFVNALHKDDQQFVALNQNLADFTTRLAHNDNDLSNAIEQFDGLLSTVRPFLNKNREVLTYDINNLATVTNTILQPDPLNGLETALHVLPTAAANINQIYHPSHGVGGRHPGDHELRQPDAVHLQLDSGRQSARVSGVRRAVRAIPGADPRCHQVQLPAVRAEPVQHRRDLSQGNRIFGRPAAPTQRIQGHHRARHLGPGHPDVAPQHPARLDRRTRDARPAGRADHRGPDDPGLAGGAHGRPEHRARPIGPADAAGTAERVRREPGRAAHRPERAGADPAAATRARTWPRVRSPRRRRRSRRPRPTRVGQRCPLTSGVASEARDERGTREEQAEPSGQ